MVLSSDIVIMSILVSMLLFFVVVVGIVIIHVFITARSVRRALVDEANNTAATTTITDHLPAQTHRGHTRHRMSQAELDKLPYYDYHGHDDDEESKNASTVLVDQFGDCAVCLDSFKAGERCRVLPLCKHSFHAKCVDGWLLKIPVCPICRDNVAVSSRRIEREESCGSGSRRSSIQFSGEMSLFGGSITTTESSISSSSRFSTDAAAFVTVVGGGRLRSVENGDVVIEMVESGGDHHGRDAVGGVDVSDHGSLSGPPRSSVDSFTL